MPKNLFDAMGQANERKWKVACVNTSSPRLSWNANMYLFPVLSCGYTHTQLSSLYPLSTFTTSHVRKKYQALHACTTSQCSHSWVWEPGNKSILLYLRELKGWLQYIHIFLFFWPSSWLLLDMKDASKTTESLLCMLAPAIYLGSLAPRPSTQLTRWKAW